MTPNIIARVQCDQCDQSVSVGFEPGRNAVSFAHDAPHCLPAYCLFGAWSDEDGDAAHLAAVAEFIVGWEVMAFVIAEEENENL